LVFILETTILEELHNYNDVIEIMDAIEAFHDEPVELPPRVPISTILESVDDEEEAEEKESTPNLEDELDEDEMVSISYSILNEELIKQQAYGAHTLDYNKMWYGESDAHSFSSDDEYWTGEITINDVEPELLLPEEAQEVLTKLQYSAIMGTTTTDKQSDKRKIDMWIMFNPALFKLFESTAMTRDVNYAPMR